MVLLHLWLAPVCLQAFFASPEQSPLLLQHFKVMHVLARSTALYISCTADPSCMFVSRTSRLDSAFPALLHLLASLCLSLISTFCMTVHQSLLQFVCPCLSFDIYLLHQNPIVSNTCKLRILQHHVLLE